MHSQANWKEKGCVIMFWHEKNDLIMSLFGNFKFEAYFHLLHNVSPSLFPNPIKIIFRVKLRKKDLRRKEKPKKKICHKSMYPAFKNNDLIWLLILLHLKHEKMLNSQVILALKEQSSILICEKLCWLFLSKSVVSPLNTFFEKSPKLRNRNNAFRI